MFVLLLYYYEPLYSALLFAYGITNAGKTFTIRGERDEEKGLLPRALETLFTRIEAVRDTNPLEIHVAYFEVYNDDIYDLLTKHTSSEPAFRKKLRMHKQGVLGLREIHVDSVEEALALIDRGQGNRMVGCNSLNADSSRSHTIFVIKLQKPCEDESMVTLFIHHIKSLTSVSHGLFASN